VAAIIFTYLVLPFVLSLLVIRLIRKRGGDPVPPEVRASCERDPIPGKWFRVARAKGELGRNARISSLGDYETQEEAVDAAYQAKEASSSTLVLNDKGEILRQV